MTTDDITPESKEEIKAAKEKQKNIIIDCDKAITDIQSNIKVLQKTLAAQNTTKKTAQDILDSLDKDFPDVPDILDIPDKTV